MHRRVGVGWVPGGRVWVRGGGGRFGGIHGVNVAVDWNR